MLIHKKIRVGKKYVEALEMKLASKNLILLKGSKGYVMCGYLNLAVAQKFEDAAVKITGVSSIKEALKARVSCCTSQARKLSIYKGQPIKEVIKIIA